MLQIKNLFLTAFLFILAFPTFVWAEEALSLDNITGVYKERFKNDDVAGEKIAAENILEIVKYDEKNAYFRTHLEFYNTHVCDIWGVATIEGDDLVYREPGLSTDEEKPCLLKMHVSDSGLELSDENKTCQITTCGANGSYEGIKFPAQSRRDIRYMDKLKKSQEYNDAVKEHLTQSKE